MNSSVTASSLSRWSSAARYEAEGRVTMSTPNDWTDDTTARSPYYPADRGETKTAGWRASESARLRSRGLTGFTR